MKKLEIVSPEAAARRLNDLLIFDARCLDRATRQELLRLIPALVHVRRQWKRRYLKYGCESCHQKTPEYGAGGFCRRCHLRINNWIRYQVRKVGDGRDAAEEVAALTRRADVAMLLLNGGE